MPLAIAYWLLMLVWLLCSVWWGYRPATPLAAPYIGWSVVLFLLFIITGLRLFGAPVH